MEQSTRRGGRIGITVGAAGEAARLGRVVIVLVGILTFGLFAMVVQAQPAWAATTCTDSLQAKIDAAPSGGTVKANACIYREQITIDKPITLSGQPGSEIRGSNVWTKWTKRKGKRYWNSKKTLPTFPQPEVFCMPGASRCKWPEQVFIDGEPLVQVASRPKAGQFSVNQKSRRVCLGENPRGHTVEVTVRRYWVLGKPEVNDVVIEGFTMRHAANEGRSGALMNRTGRLQGGGGRWTVRNNVLTDAHGAILSIKNARGRLIADNEIARGGQIGIFGAGPGTAILGNDIHDNNTERFAYNAAYGIGETGGMKLAANVRDTVVAHNDIHDNYGHGIHYDINCLNNSIHHNRIYDNARLGVQYELCDGGEIYENVVFNNGWATPAKEQGAGIRLLNSTDVEVHNNTLAWNAEGIGVYASDRAGTENDDVANVYVHHNTVFSQNGPTAAENGLALYWKDGTGQLADAANNNRGENNLYWYPSDEGALHRFQWRTQQLAELSTFNTTPGEKEGSYMTMGEKDAVAAAVNIPASPTLRRSNSW